MRSDHRGRSASFSRADVLQAYGRLPVSFQPNRGQSVPRVRFLARGAGYGLYLTPSDAVLALERPTVGAGSATSRLGRLTRSASAETVIRMAFRGASPNPQINGTRELPGRTNYLIGNDRAAWRTGVPSYTAVTYKDLYPGVSLQFSGGGGHLEYMFSLAPGADPGVVRLGFTGQHGISIDPAGNLVLQLPGGQVVEDRPFIYQDTGHGRREVAGRYVLLNGGGVGFSVGSHDLTRTLFIDPVLSYSTYLGAGADEVGIGVQVDASGNAYVTGLTKSMNFPHTSGSYHGGLDAFVTKLNPAGSGLVYSTLVGGSRDDVPHSIAVDPTGRAYITGFTSSTNFPTTTGAFDRSFNGVFDAFLAKLNPTGTGLNYSTYLGGTGTDDATGVTLDANGTYPFVTGQTTSKNFPLSASAFQKTNHGGSDIFVTKVNPNPHQPLLYSTYVGGRGDDVGASVALGDSAGRVFVGGGTGSSNYPTTAGALDRTYNGGFDVILTKINPSGSGLNYSTYLGSNLDDEGQGVAVDASGNAYLTGGTASTTFPTTAGAYDRTYNGGAFDAFVTKINPNPNQPLVYSTFIGGDDLDFSSRMQVDSSGNAHVVGMTASTNFPATGTPFQPAYGGGDFDGFVTEVNPTGGGLVYSSFLGGSKTDEVIGLSVDPSGNEYVVGDTNSTDFPTAGTPFQPKLKGGSDAFVTKITPGPGSRR